MMQIEGKKADANPTKAFFVRMITRDIMLEDCILDLIDNSIDGAWQLEGAKPMTLNDDVDLSKYQIQLEVTPDHFRIIDDCGGISLDDAVQYAFTFGRKETDERDDYSIGVYGIGMKRAVFKMGEAITVKSTHIEDDGDKLTFSVPIDVEEWLKIEGWDFDIENAEELDSAGVEVFVEKLTESTSNSFSDPAFIQRLRRTIARDYSLHLHRGLSISLNGETISGWSIELREGGGFVPMRIGYEDVESDTSVSVEILAGMAAPPPESSEPDERGDREREPKYGWYVICNGRVVLSADTTYLTGWGNMAPKWHPQYAGFIGLIIFSSEDAASLPLTTTKRSIDASSDIYRRALPKMRDVAAAWIAYTNDRKQSIEEAKKHEEEAKPKPIYEIDNNKFVQVPAFQQKPKVRMANIAGVLEILCHFSNMSKKRNDTCPKTSISRKPSPPCAMART